VYFGQGVLLMCSLHTRTAVRECL